MVVRSKYGAIKTVCKAKHRHASRKEAKRCDELSLLEKAGEIAGLTQQPKYDIWIESGDFHAKICTYVADFRYKEGGATIVEDVKGVRTSTYRLKRKLMKIVHGIDIRET